MAINRDSTTPPPMIGKIGPYTVFMTPPSTPKPSQPPFLDSPKKILTPPPVLESPKKIITPPPVLDSPKKIITPPPVLDSPKKIITPPPVQPPPLQFHKSTESVASNGSVLGFFKNAATKVQNAHSSLDDHLARWFGLNQSKYQWALDDYYESKGSVSV